MRILFYTPLNTRCRDLESQAAAFVKRGHAVSLMTQSGRGPLHDNFQGYGYGTAFQRNENAKGAWVILYRCFSLIAFCRRHKIELVYAHLEPANFVAVLAQYFLSARVIICRHHIDEARLYKFDQSIAYRLTYRLARTIIVVSDRARRYMIEAERILASKIHVVPLAYDFALYEQSNSEEVDALRRRHKDKVQLVDVCRLTSHKRPFELLALAHMLVERKIPFHLTLLGKGELDRELRMRINHEGLEGLVEMPGYVNNVLTYLASADLLVHPSVLESSCITVKEAGLVGLPVVVCTGVGDFDETLTHGRDSFLVDPQHFAKSTAELVDQLHRDPIPFRAAGQNLSQTIRSHFSIDKVAPTYDKFHVQ